MAERLLKEAVRELSSIDADEAELAYLRGAEELPARTGRRWFLAAAASLVGVGATALYWQTAKISPLDRVFADIVRLHLEPRQLEYQAATLNELAPMFAGKGFWITSSSRLEQLPGTLMGARNCTICGVDAALIRYKLDDEMWASAYQAAYRPGSHGSLPDVGQGQAPIRRVERGLDVTVWCERGLLCAKVMPM